MEEKDKKFEMGNRIAEQGFNLFRLYGIRAVTLDEIALQLGISKKTIYEHFAGKDDLVTQIVQRRLEMMKEQSVAFGKEAKNAIEANMMTGEMLNTTFRNMNPLVIMDMQKFHPRAYSLYQEHMYDFVLEQVISNIKRGMEEGFYRENIDIDIMARFRVESCILCFKPGIFPKDHFEMAKVQNELLEHFLLGIATEKGHKLILKYLNDRLKKKD
jgi:AcrR family transcriptional regulator